MMHVEVLRLACHLLKSWSLLSTVTASEKALSIQTVTSCLQGLNAASRCLSMHAKYRRPAAKQHFTQRPVNQHTGGLVNLGQACRLTGHSHQLSLQLGQSGRLPKHGQHGSLQHAVVQLQGHCLCARQLRDVATALNALRRVCSQQARRIALEGPHAAQQLRVIGVGRQVEDVLAPTCPVCVVHDLHPAV